MPTEQPVDWARVQRLLVVEGEVSPASQEAIALLRELDPDRVIDLLQVLEDEGTSLTYRLPGEIPLAVRDHSPDETIDWIRHRRLDAVLILMPLGRSSYGWAYRCYLAGVPIRIGQSSEFAGQVLSHCLPLAPADCPNPYGYLLQACGLLPSPSPSPAASKRRLNSCTT